MAGLIALVAVVSSCAVSTGEPPTSGLPTYRDGGSWPLAGATGALEIVGDCVTLRADDGTRYALVWPTGSTMRGSGSDVEVTVPSGAVLRSGRVTLTGGETSTEAPVLSGMTLPPSCEGLPLWLVAP